MPTMAAVLLAAALAIAQQPPATQTAGQAAARTPASPAAPAQTNPQTRTPAITARTELVLVPVLVTDHSGKHIPGLQQSQFTLLEDGSERKIALFREVSEDARRPVLARAPGAYSNFDSGGGGAPESRVTIVLLDLLNTPFLGQAYARKGLLKYLSDSLDAREPTALYVLTRGGLRVVQDFTTDPAILVAAVHKLKGDNLQMVDSSPDAQVASSDSSDSGDAASAAAGSGSGPPSAGDAVDAEMNRLQALMDEAEQNFQSEQQRAAIQYTLDALNQIAQRFAGVPGRKALIWATGGFPFTVTDDLTLPGPGRASLTDVLPLYRQTWLALNQAQIAVYPVDANGLVVNPTDTAEYSGRPPGTGRNPGAAFQRQMNHRANMQASFQTFAKMTGGLAFLNTNDLADCFRQAVRDSASYYLLGFYLNPSDRPGWHKLAVKVSEKHVRVRARTGFAAGNPAAETRSVAFQEITLALESPLDYTGIEILAQCCQVAAAHDPAKKRVQYALHLPRNPAWLPGAAVPAPGDASSAAQPASPVRLEFLALALASDGSAASPPAGKTLAGNLTPGAVSDLRQHGLTFNGSLDLAPGSYRLRFVVRDDLRGAIGSVSAPVTVP